jgi:hypothetical protein
MSADIYYVDTRNAPDIRSIMSRNPLTSVRPGGRIYVQSSRQRPNIAGPRVTSGRGAAKPASGVASTAKVTIPGSRTIATPSKSRFESPHRAHRSTKRCSSRGSNLATT